MSNYTKGTNFTAKDSLITGNPSKLVKGAEIDTELNAISAAIATKIDTAAADAKYAALAGTNTMSGTSDYTTGTIKVPTKTQGDNSTNASSTAYTDAAVAAEATLRSSGDSNLQTQLNSEITNRQNADSTLQTNINNEATARANADATKGNITGQTWTGTHDFTGATPLVPTTATSDSSNNAASTKLVDNKIAAQVFAATLPNQSANARKTITTDGANARWDWTDATGPVSVASQVLSLPNGQAANTSCTCIPLDATHDLILFGTGWSVVYDSGANQYGTVVYAGFYAANRAIKVSSTQVLVVSAAATTLTGVVLTISGTVISVGAANNQTLANTFSSLGDVINVGGTYVISVNYSTGAGVVGATVSGSTVTFGAVLAVSGTTGAAILDVVNSTQFLCTSYIAGTCYVDIVSVSGTTLTKGTGATFTMTSGTVYGTAALNTGRFMVVLNNNTTLTLLNVSISGTTVTLTSVGPQNTPSSIYWYVYGSNLHLLFTNGSTVYLYAIYDNNGTFTTSFNTLTVTGTAVCGFLGQLGSNVYIYTCGSGAGAELAVFSVSITGTVTNNINFIASTAADSTVWAATGEAIPRHAGITPLSLRSANYLTHLMTASGAGNVCFDGTSLKRFLLPNYSTFSNAARYSKGATDAVLYAVSSAQLGTNYACQLQRIVLQ